MNSVWYYSKLLNLRRGQQYPLTWSLSIESACGLETPNMQLLSEVGAVLMGTMFLNQWNFPLTLTL